jgi:hypothetical protein
MIDIDKNECFRCSCGDSVDHMMVVHIYAQDDYKDLSFHLQMNEYLPLYSRIIAAFKYIFGFKSRFHWAETIIKNEDISRLKAFIQEYENIEVDMDMSFMKDIV